MYLHAILSILSILMISTGPPPPAGDARHLTLVTVEHSADTVIGEIVIVEAYRRLGIIVSIKRYPGERALRMADHGQVDGEVQRIDAIRDHYPHLIQVNPPVNHLEASVFSKDAAFVPDGWASLKPYSIGLIRGIKFAENNTLGMNRHLVSGYESLFIMLDRGRFEIAVMPKINAMIYARSVDLDEIKLLEPPVARFMLYHYLHEKNADLVPAISGVLKEMEQAGEIEAIREHVLSAILDRASKKRPLFVVGQSSTSLYGWKDIEPDTDTVRDTSTQRP